MLEKAKEEVLENELIQQYINTNSDLSKIHQISHIIYEQVNDTKYYQNKKLLKYVKNCKKNNIISFLNEEIYPKKITYSIYRFIRVNKGFENVFFYYIHNDILGCYDISIKPNNVHINRCAKIRLINNQRKIDFEMNYYQYLDFSHNLYMNRIQYYNNFIKKNRNEKV